MHIDAISMEWSIHLFSDNRFDDSNQCRLGETRFMRHLVEVFIVCRITYEIGIRNVKG